MEIKPSEPITGVSLRYVIHTDINSVVYRIEAYGKFANEKETENVHRAIRDALVEKYAETRIDERGDYRRGLVVTTIMHNDRKITLNAQIPLKRTYLEYYDSHARKEAVQATEQRRQQQAPRISPGSL